MKLQLTIKKLSHPRQARRMEKNILKLDGVHTASVSTSGMVVIDCDRNERTTEYILNAIRNMGYAPVVVDKEKHHKDDGHEHDTHQRLMILGENTELYFAIGSGLFWVLGIVFTFLLDVSPTIPVVLYLIACVLGGVFTLVTALSDVLKGRFEIDFLMLFAAIGAIALGKWSEAALLLFLFSLGHALEHYAMKRARKSIAALSDLAPPTALRKVGDQLEEVHIEKLKVGDIIVVKPNSKIAADGAIIDGHSAVNQASITGESIPVDKSPIDTDPTEASIDKLDAKHRAFAGTINGSGVLEVYVMRKAKDSTLAKLITLVQEAETQKSPTQHLTDKFEKYYVPSVLVVVVLLLFAYLVIDESFQDSFYRAMSVLIAASPCALAISTPSAILAGIARAARQGVLIKGGLPLEKLGTLNAIAFDKTGTLTEGKPTLTDAIPYGSHTQKELLEVAIAVEMLSDHPLAAAIVAGGKKILGNVDIEPADDIYALTARGVKAEWKGATVHIGNRRLFEELTGAPVPEEIDHTMSQLESTGNTAMIVHYGSDYRGVISVMDVARPEAIATLKALKKVGIQRMIMLTGDHQKVADAIAKQIGITDPLGSLLPEDKVSSIERLKEEVGSVAMVGDGVNDAPAMAKSTVGIAMGAAGSDVALETADIALMADKLDNLPFAIGLSRKTRRIIKQNLVISLGMVAILVPLTIMGAVAIGPAVVGHEGSTLLVVLNALRLLRYK